MSNVSSTSSQDRDLLENTINRIEHIVKLPNQPSGPAPALLLPAPALAPAPAHRQIRQQSNNNILPIGHTQRNPIAGSQHQPGPDVVQLKDGYLKDPIPGAFDKAGQQLYSSFVDKNGVEQKHCLRKQKRESK